MAAGTFFSASATGLLPIEGRLSYIENNERRTYELQRITVDLGAPAVANNAHEEEDDDPELMDLVSAAGGAPATGRTRIMVIDDVSGKPPVQGPGGVSGTRTITPVSTNEMRVEVSVKKGDLRGFGKLQENVPDGFTAIEETDRRRAKQIAHTEANGISPEPLRKKIHDILDDIYREAEDTPKVVAHRGSLRVRCQTRTMASTPEPAESRPSPERAVAELSSVATNLEDLVHRVATAAEALSSSGVRPRRRVPARGRLPLILPVSPWTSIWVNMPSASFGCQRRAA